MMAITTKSSISVKARRRGHRSWFMVITSELWMDKDVRNSGDGYCL
jgi:hypothetical protein